MDYLRERAAIEDLNIYYALMCDTFQLEETVACWTPDGVFDESESGYGRIAGHEQLRPFFRDRIFATAQAVVHMMFNHLITDIGEDSAKGTVFTLVEVIKKDGARSRVHAKYEDDYVKVDGAWKFQNRVIRASFPREIITTAA